MLSFMCRWIGRIYLRYSLPNAKEKSVLILDRHHVVTSPSNWVERDASRKEEIA